MNQERVIKLIEENCALNEQIHEDNFFYELSLDSLSYVSLIVEIEEMFHIEFEDEFLVYNSQQTIREFIAVVSSKVAAQQVKREKGND